MEKKLCQSWVFLAALCTTAIGFIVFGYPPGLAIANLAFLGLAVAGMFRLIFLTPTMENTLASNLLCVASFAIWVLYIFGAMSIVANFNERHFGILRLALMADAVSLVIGAVFHGYYRWRDRRSIPTLPIMALTLLGALATGLRIHTDPFCTNLVVNEQCAVFIMACFFQAANVIVGWVFRNHTDPSARHAFAITSPTWLRVADRFLLSYGLGGLPELTFGPVCFIALARLLENVP